MSQISVKVNLGNLKCVVKSLVGKSGAVQDCLIIPIDANKLIRGKEGIYLDLIAFKLKDMRPDSPDTHCVRQSFSKEYLASIPESEKNELPFLGSLIDWDNSTRVNTFVDLSTTIPQGDIPTDLPF